MANTALNRTTQVLLTNKSGGALVYGDVVVLDNTNANGFITTTSAGLSTRGLGVILEPNGIANNASGMVAVGGWCPQVNLNTAAAVGQFIKTHTVAGQGTPHASPQVEGDFAVALSASATPACNLFGSPNGPLSGGSGTVTHTAGALTSNAVVIGNASADVTVLASLGTSGWVLTSAGAGAPPVFAAPAASGALVLIEQHTASSSASLDFTACITSTYDDYLIRFVDVIPATNAVSLLMRVSTNGGSSYDSTAIYDWGGGYGYRSSSGGYGSTSQTAWEITGGNSNSANYGMIGEVSLVNPARTSGYKTMVGTVSSFDTGVSTPVTKSTQWVYLSATAVNAFQFLMSSGNIASGTIRCYGYAK